MGKLLYRFIQPLREIAKVSGISLTGRLCGLARKAENHQS